MVSGHFCPEIPSLSSNPHFKLQTLFSGFSVFYIALKAVFTGMVTSENATTNAMELNKTKQNIFYSHFVPLDQNRF